LKVVFTRRAALTLEQIVVYIAIDNPERALTFVREIRAKASALAEMPHAFPLVPRFERYGIRRRVHGHYLILYAVRGDHIAIIAFVHGARDYGGLLFPEE
jgi:plasmid stabilization system protein ParE